MNRTYTVLSEEQKADIEKYAELKFSMSEISKMVRIPIEEFRLRLMNPDDELAMAYDRGKLLGEAAYREKLLDLAKKGNAWAIQILEKKSIKQLEEELGCNG